MSALSPLPFQKLSRFKESNRYSKGSWGLLACEKTWDDWIYCTFSGQIEGEWRLLAKYPTHMTGCYDVKWTIWAYTIKFQSYCCQLSSGILLAFHIGQSFHPEPSRLRLILQNFPFGCVGFLKMLDRSKPSQSQWWFRTSSIGYIESFQVWCHDEKCRLLSNF